MKIIEHISESRAWPEHIVAAMILARIASMTTKNLPFLPLVEQATALHCNVHVRCMHLCSQMGAGVIEC